MNIKTKKKTKVWLVYILRCADDSLYTGVTNNIEKRFAAHTQGKAAKYTHSRRPVKLLAKSSKMGKSDAMRLEIKIKKMPRLKKLDALTNCNQKVICDRKKWKKAECKDWIATPDQVEARLA